MVYCHDSHSQSVKHRMKRRMNESFVSQFSFGIEWVLNCLREGFRLFLIFLKSKVWAGPGCSLQL